tara:strand:- start:752 stop:940 length:189 start_codon:yes stop_codon:yes gene_type:complete
MNGNLTEQLTKALLQETRAEVRMNAAEDDYWPDRYPTALAKYNAAVLKVENLMTKIHNQGGE